MSNCLGSELLQSSASNLDLAKTGMPSPRLEPLKPEKVGLDNL